MFPCVTYGQALILCCWRISQVNHSDPFGLCFWDACIAEAYGTAIMAAGVAAIATAAWIDVTNKYGPPSAWFSSSSTSGENSAARRGREAHKAWNPGSGFDKEVTLPSGKRCDAYNPQTCEVKELKPNNPRAIKRGEKQVKEYAEELERETGKKHTGKVETYNP